jgi:hypothetical protein
VLKIHRLNLKKMMLHLLKEEKEKMLLLKILKQL